jgi:uncharacterized membrane protein
MYELWLFLHVLGAIAAFGFGFYSPIYGMATRREPEHLNWFLRASARVSRGILIPVAISMAVTGTLLVASTGGMRRFEELWLMVSLLLYVIALGIILIGQRPITSRVIALTATPPSAGAPPGVSAELPALVRKLQVYGMVVLALVIVIVALMVWKPVL